MHQLEKTLNKKNIVSNIISKIQTIDSQLVRNTLKELVELTSVPI